MIGQEDATKAAMALTSEQDTVAVEKPIREHITLADYRKNDRIRSGSCPPTDHDIEEALKRIG